MRPSTVLSRKAFAGILLCAAMATVSIVPVIVDAQSSTAASTENSETLNATIRAAILKDPRSAGLSSAQIDAMVTALSAQAQQQGMTPQDIAYHPGAVVPRAPGAYTPGVCTDISAPLCRLGQALGFDNPDKSVAIGLWLTSGMLILVIWLLRRRKIV